LARYSISSIKFKIYIQQYWREIQSVVSNSKLYTTKLVRYSISSIKFKFIYNKIGEKFNLYYQIQIFFTKKIVEKYKERLICITSHTEGADSRSAGCGFLSFYWKFSVIKIFNINFRLHRTQRRVIWWIRHHPFGRNYRSHFQGKCYPKDDSSRFVITDGNNTLNYIAMYRDFIRLM
jgi:hypothetical protein